MKLAVATPDEMWFHEGTSKRYVGWVLFPTDFVRPSEIRARILTLIREEDADEEGNLEHALVTMNRTVLDMVTHPEIKNAGPMDYGDVYIWSDADGDLNPLLNLHSEDWLAHSALGDIIDREL